MRTRYVQNRMPSRVRVAGCDARIVERGRQKLALDRGSVASVVTAATIFGLEVQGFVFLITAAVPRREDATGPNILASTVGSGSVHALVENAELVPLADAAVEVELPCEHVRKCRGQRRIFPEVAYRLVERGLDDASHADNVWHQFVHILARVVQPVRVAHQVDTFVCVDPVVERQNLAFVIEDESILLARACAAEAEHGAQLAGNHMNDARPNVEL